MVAIMVIAMSDDDGKDWEEDDDDHGYADKHHGGHHDPMVTKVMMATLVVAMCISAKIRLPEPFRRWWPGDCHRAESPREVRSPLPCVYLH